MTQPEWDDERLAATFHDRFDGPAPDGVARSIQDAIAGVTPDQSRSRRGDAKTWAGSVAAVLVVAVSAAVVGSMLLRPAGAPVASSSGATSTADPSTPGTTPVPATGADVPASVQGMDVVTVSDALAVRDGGVDDRELAVSGWFTPIGPIPCPYPGELTSPIQLRCPDSMVWMTEAPEALFHRTANSETMKPPDGPGLNPDLDGIDRQWVPSQPAVGESVPVAVVFVGHFDDRRAELCPAAEQAECRDRFVVDRVAWVDGVEQPLSDAISVDGTPVRSTLDEILAIVARETTDSPVLSVVTADDANIRWIEPELWSGHGPGRMVAIPVAWVVRVLEGGRAVTYAVRDGTDMIWEMTADGPVQVGGPIIESPTPAPEPPEGSVWPPEGSVLVRLTSEVGGDDPVEVAVIDHSGRLIAAQEKGSMDPFFGLVGMAYAEPGFPGRVHLSWAGGVCDSHVVVTVAPDLQTITLDTGPQTDCDAMGVGRELVLDFSGTVDVPTTDIVKVPILD